jgi:hypothetical protein
VRRARIVRPLAAAALATLGIVACANNKAALGDPCLRSEDCLTEVCIAFTCSSVLPVTDTPSGPSDAGVDSGVDTGAPDAAPPEASAELDADAD